MLINLEEQVFEHDIHFKFLAANNIAKYEALIARLRLVEALNAYPL
jgi:hypothetical protein